MAGGLFHFKKDHAEYSLKPDDYATKPLFVASKDNTLLNEFFLCGITNLGPGDVAYAGPGVGHTPSKTSRVHFAAFRSSPMSSSTPRLCQAPLAGQFGILTLKSFVCKIVIMTVIS
jgi:hypothetical protein